MIITDEWLRQHSTLNAGWTRQQLALLGVPWPAKKGWLSNLTQGRHEIPDDDAREFERLWAERQRKLARRRQLNAASTVANDATWDSRS